MRFRLAAGEESSVYRPGQFVSAEYASRYPHKVAGEEPEELPPDYEPEPYDYEDYGDFWEITFEYEET